MKRATELIGAIALAMVANVCGCRSVVMPIARVYNPYDPMSAENLAKTRPALQNACEAAGSCGYIVVDCWKSDGKSFCHVYIPGGYFDDPASSAYGSGYTIDEAAASFAESVRARRAEAACKKDHPEKGHIITPCDADCGGAK